MKFSDEQLIKLMNQMELVTNISQLPNFPWSNHSYSDLIELIKKKEITPSILYDPDARHAILSKKEKIFTDILGNLMFLIPIAFIGIAIWTKEWLLLTGSIGFLIAAFLSNPWARKVRQFLLTLSIVIVIVSVFLNYYIVASIFGGLFLSILLAVFSREFVNAVVKREITKSEPLFCYTYQTGLLLLKDNQTDEIYGKIFFSK
jgi:hypothetical protein